MLLTKIDDPNFTIQMESCQILSHIVGMDDQITREIELVSMSGTSMLYPVRWMRMLYYSKGANTANLNNFNLLIGEGNLLPRCIFVMMLREDAMHGHMNCDPFNYQSFGLSTVCLRVGGWEQPYPSFDCNFETRNVWPPLFTLLQSNNSFLNEVELGYNVYMYNNRNVILGFNLSGSQTPPGESFEMTQEKTVELILKLANPQAFVINVLIYAEYDAEIEILSDRQVVQHDYA